MCGEEREKNGVRWEEFGLAATLRRRQPPPPRHTCAPPPINTRTCAKAWPMPPWEQPVMRMVVGIGCGGGEGGRDGTD